MVNEAMTGAIHEVRADEALDAPPRYEPEPSDGAPWLSEHITMDDWNEAEPESPYRGVIGGFVVLLALIWTGTVAWAAGQAVGGAPTSAPELVRWAAIASGPLALLGLGWLLFGRSSRRETVAFTRNVQAMRGESEALQAVLVAVGRQIETNRTTMAEESGRLMSLGEEAAARLGAVTRDVDAGAQAMARYADILDRAAGSARTDIGVLLADIPRAEAQARAMAETLRTAGIDAHQQAGALEAQVGALAARARETDDAVGGAAGRLTAYIAQVESATGTATDRMESATAFMSSGVDTTLVKAADAVDAARQGLEEQGNAMIAMIEQSSAALDQVGVDAGRNLAQRIDDIGSRLDGLATRLAAQDTASHATMGGIDGALAALETRLSALSASGGERMAALSTTLDGLAATIDTLLLTVAGGDAGIGALATRAGAIRTAIEAIGRDLQETLPAGLAQVEAQAGRSFVAAAALNPQVAHLLEAATATQVRLDQSRALVLGQRDEIDALLGKVDSGLEAMHERVGALGVTVTDTDLRAEKLARDTGPQLIEALLRVREAANQAAARAREAIGSIVPEAAAALGEASGAAMSQVFSAHVSAQMGQLGALTEAAVEAARAASERLTRQMVTIGETTAAVEARIDEAQVNLRENDSENFSRRVALLIESLNSTAIDVTKILSNEVTDSAWAAYLKGDRGVFTRRAVRLLDTGEAREIARHYEEEPEFREQVNRYIHDFEALLRRVLAERDGSPMGVTLLSSDVGKLYVALAQAIERIRG